jgi:protocatechuate 3,4-dioxygenase beta subunit
MKKAAQSDFSRREFIRSLLLVPLGWIIGTFRGRAAVMLEPTPASGDDHDPTPPNIEGPFFKPKSPERGSLREKEMPGVPLVITGRILSTEGKPIPNALLDFWQADSKGDYDNAGFRLRGHQFTDKEGRYRLETIMPGQYADNGVPRPPHIHVKAQAPNKPVLTTQLYFPNEPRNKGDRFFDVRLLVKMKEAKEAKEGKAGVFDFVLKL